ncbi:MAG: glycosyltransferase [Planctomycetaceae bacterium]
MRITFLAGTLGLGGAERQLFHILGALRRYGAEVRLLSLTRGEAWEERIRAEGVEVEWVGRRESRLLRLARIAAALRRDRPDIVQSQHFFTNLYAVGAARLAGCREVCAIRGDGLIEVRRNGWLGRMSLTAPRTLAANSRAAIEQAVSFGVPRERLHWLPNVVDTDQFRPAPAPRRRPFTLLWAGRLAAVKSPDRFVRLVAAVRAATRCAVAGVVVGDGPLRDALQGEAERLGLGPDGLRFAGAAREMAPRLLEADLLVSTSEHEGTPNVILEAMAAGLPVVATAVGGVPDLVLEGETGWLFPPGEEAEMARAVTRLVEDPASARAAGARARARAETVHGLDVLPAHLERLYRAVIA